MIQVSALRRFDIANKKISKKGLLYFDNISIEHVRDIDKNVETFLQKFFKRNDKHTTRYYSTGRIQCYKECRRSVEDIYRITKYYFPNVRLIEILAFLVNNIGNKGLRLSTDRCDVILKQVYFKEPYNPLIYTKNQLDGMGIYPYEYNEIIKNRL
jgi:hypothetical protein